MRPNIKERGVKGMVNGRKQCQPYWDEFYENRDKLIFESEKILSTYQDTDIETKFRKELEDIPKEIRGEVRLREVKTRVNQYFFRRMVLANYDETCALSGVDINTLLIASHIIPWSENEKERLNPENGICLSALYDKAFDKGLISFDDNGKTIFSKRLKENVSKEYYAKFFLPIESKKLSTPNKYKPNPLFLEWHRDVIFQK